MRLSDLFRSSANSALWYAALVFVLPLSSLSILGLLYLWEHSLLIWVLIAWLIVTMLGYAVMIAWPRRSGKTSISDTDTTLDSTLDDQLPDQLEEGTDWTQTDKDIWRQRCQHIETILASRPAWDSLPGESLNVLSAVSAGYNDVAKKSAGADTDDQFLKYRFTLPEALLVLSVASRRYRELVLKNVPFVDKVTVATLFSLYDKQQSVKTSYAWLNGARRLLRLSNPAAAVVGELRDQFTNRVFTQLSENVQTDLKRLLLQEVVQVGMDLYSGRLKSSAEELELFKTQSHYDDLERVPQVQEPLRFVFLGQISAGKSSLINALGNSLSAEIDILPTTQGATTYQLNLPESATVHLIDTRGIEHDAATQQAAVKQALEADLVILVMRATQPARAPDQMLIQAIESAFSDRPERRAPPTLLVMTHVDQLSPRASWSPPYDLQGDDPKASNIAKAMNSALQQTGLPTHTLAIPVCLSSEKEPYNVEALAAQLMALQQKALLAQMNRRRLEHGEQSVNWSERWAQFRRLGQVMGRAVVGKNSSRDQR